VRNGDDVEDLTLVISSPLSLSGVYMVALSLLVDSAVNVEGAVFFESAVLVVGVVFVWVPFRVGSRIDIVRGSGSA
jgi:hypothetical protein